MKTVNPSLCGDRNKNRHEFCSLDAFYYYLDKTHFYLQVMITVMYITFSLILHRTVEYKTQKPTH